MLEQTIEQLRKEVEERSLQQKRHEHELEELSTVATRHNNLLVLILGKADTLDTSTQVQKQLEVALEKEVKRLRDVSEKNSTLPTDITIVTREKQEVEERLTELNKALKEHELEILQLKNSEKQLQQSTEALHFEIKKKSSELDKLTVEVSNMTRTNQELSEQNIQSKQVVTEQSGELALLQEKAKELQVKLDQMAEQSAKNLNSMKKTLQMKNTTITGLENDKGMLNEEQEALKSQIKDLKSVVATALDINHQLLSESNSSMLSERANEMRYKLSQYSAIQEDRENLRQRSKALKVEVEELTEANQQALALLEEAQSNITKIAEQKEDQVTGLEKKNKKDVESIRELLQKKSEQIKALEDERRKRDRDFETLNLYLCVVQALPILSYGIPINQVVVWYCQIVRSVNRQTLLTRTCRKQFALLAPLVFKGLESLFDSQRDIKHHFVPKLRCIYLCTLRKNRLSRVLSLSEDELTQTKQSKLLEKASDLRDQLALLKITQQENKQLKESSSLQIIELIDCKKQLTESEQELRSVNEQLAELHHRKNSQEVELRTKEEELGVVTAKLDRLKG